MASIHASKREIEILQLICAEKTIKVIATELFISPHTVVSHKKNLKRKLKAKNTAGLIYKGFLHGYLRL